MKVIQLSESAAAFEFDKFEDSIQNVSEEQLRKRGLSEEAIKIFTRFKGGPIHRPVVPVRAQPKQRDDVHSQRGWLSTVPAGN